MKKQQRKIQKRMEKWRRKRKETKKRKKEKKLVESTQVGRALATNYVWEAGVVASNVRAVPVSIIGEYPFF